MVNTLRKMRRVVRIDAREVLDHLQQQMREPIAAIVATLLEKEMVQLEVPENLVGYTELVGFLAKAYDSSPEHPQVELLLAREESIVESLSDMYLDAVTESKIEDLLSLILLDKEDTSLSMRLNRILFNTLQPWRNSEIQGACPCVYLDSVMVKQSVAGVELELSTLVALAVSRVGKRRMISVTQGRREDRDGWVQFVGALKQRGLSGVRVFVCDGCPGLVETLAHLFPQARWQPCAAQHSRNTVTMVPKGRNRRLTVPTRVAKNTIPQKF